MHRLLQISNQGRLPKIPAVRQSRQARPPTKQPRSTSGAHLSPAIAGPNSTGHQHTTARSRPAPAPSCRTRRHTWPPTLRTPTSTGSRHRLRLPETAPAGAPPSHNRSHRPGSHTQAPPPESTGGRRPAAGPARRPPQPPPAAVAYRKPPPHGRRAPKTGGTTRARTSTARRPHTGSGPAVHGSGHATAGSSPAAEEPAQPPLKLPAQHPLFRRRTPREGPAATVSRTGFARRRPPAAVREESRELRLWGRRPCRPCGSDAGVICAPLKCRICTQKKKILH